MRADGGGDSWWGANLFVRKRGAGNQSVRWSKGTGQLHNHRNSNYNSENANFSINLGNRTEDAQIFEVVRKIRVPSTCINNVGLSVQAPHIFDIFRWNIFHFTLTATIPMQITYKYNPFPFDQPQI